MILSNGEFGIKTLSHSPAATTIATVTIPAVAAGEYSELIRLTYGYDTASGGVEALTIVSGSTTHTIPVPNAAATYQLDLNIFSEVNTSIVIALSAPGSGSGFVMAQYRN